MTAALSDQLNLRRSARYFVKKPANVGVEVRYQVDGEHRTTACELADISSQGMKLKTSSTFAIKQSVQIRLTVASCQTELDLRGEVCWSRPCDQQFTWIGILLSSEISIEQLDRFAVQGIIDRRRDRRLEVEADVLVRFELGSEVHRAKILDLSQGGFSVVTTETVNVGDRILLIVDPDAVNAAPIPGRICWMRADGSSCIYGCEFLSATAAAVVRSRLAHRDSHQDEPANLVRPITTGSSTILLAGGTCLIALLCWQMSSRQSVRFTSQPVTAPVPVSFGPGPAFSLPVDMLNATAKPSCRHDLLPYVDWFFDRWFGPTPDQRDEKAP
jgi:Tfp pilus assembly protein PilZ